MKRGVLGISICLVLVFVLLASFVSAGLFSKNKITGEVVSGSERVIENPKGTDGSYILVSKYYYGDDYTEYAGTYCEKVQGCTGFKDVVVKDDAVKACRCDDFWGCPYDGTAGRDPSCVGNVALSSTWERVASVTCTGCPVEEEKVSVDLKVNGKDNPDPVLYKSAFEVSWEVEGLTGDVQCNPFGTWVPTSDGKSLWNNFKSLGGKGSKSLMAAWANNGNLNDLNFISSLQIGISCSNGSVDSTSHVIQFSDTINVPVSSQTCTDSDGGLNYYEKGTTSSREIASSDSCEGGILFERYCKEEGGSSDIAYECPNGCVDGACVSPTQKSYCKDGDCFLYEGEKVYPYVSPKNLTVTISYISSTQVILTVDGINTNLLSQYQTQLLGNDIKISIVNIFYNSKTGSLSGVNFKIEESEKVKCSLNSDCSDLGMCIDGFCVEFSCFDSDGGRNYYVSGSTSLYPEGLYTGETGAESDTCGIPNYIKLIRIEEGTDYWEGINSCDSPVSQLDAEIGDCSIGGYKTVDSCEGKDCIVVETYCTNEDLVYGIFKDEYFFCSNGCQDGACVLNECSTDTDCLVNEECVSGICVQSERECSSISSKSDCASPCFWIGDSCVKEKDLTYYGERSYCYGEGYGGECVLYPGDSIYPEDPAYNEDYAPFAIRISGHESGGGARPVAPISFEVFSWGELEKEFSLGLFEQSSFIVPGEEENGAEVTFSLKRVNSEDYLSTGDYSVLIGIELSESVHSCDLGCSSGGKCYPFGYRKSGMYCNDNYEFVNQLGDNAACDNNFECGTNLCVDGQCVSRGLIQRILEWFGRFFGS